MPPATWNTSHPSQLCWLTPESGPGGTRPPPPFPSCDPSGVPQQPLLISVTLLCNLQGVLPEGAKALLGWIPGLFNGEIPITLYTVGAQ